MDPEKRQHQQRSIKDFLYQYQKETNLFGADYVATIEHIGWKKIIYSDESFLYITIDSNLFVTKGGAKIGLDPYSINILNHDTQVYEDPSKRLLTLSNGQESFPVILQTVNAANPNKDPNDLTDHSLDSRERALTKMRNAGFRVPQLYGFEITNLDGDDNSGIYIEDIDLPTIEEILSFFSNPNGRPNPHFASIHEIIETRYRGDSNFFMRQLLSSYYRFLTEVHISVPFIGNITTANTKFDIYRDSRDPKSIFIPTEPLIQYR